MKNKKYLMADISFLLALIFSVSVYGMRDFSSGCENIKDNVLRLHVIANSDTEEDQQLKLRVRDAIIETGALIFDECENKDQAAAVAQTQKAHLTNVAEEAIKAEGLSYPVSVEIGRERYPARTYETATLPAGEYLSLRVIIGEGAGQNWWCVVFPPMCISAATKAETLETVLNEDGLMVVNSDPKYEVRFRIVEWWERLFNA